MRLRRCDLLYDQPANVVYYHTEGNRSLHEKVGQPAS